MVVRHTLGPVITIAATVVVVVVKSQEWRAESHPAKSVHHPVYVKTQHYNLSP